MKYTLLLVICLVTVLNCVPQKTQKQLFGLADAAGLALDVASLVLPQNEKATVLSQKQLFQLKDVVKAGKKAYKFYKSHKFYFDMAYKYAQTLAQNERILAQKKLFGFADAAALALDVASLVLPQDEAKNVLAQKQLLALKDVVKAGKKAYNFYKSHKFYFDLAFKFAQSLAQKQLFDLADA